MSVHDHAEGWFERAHAALLGALPCRRGCHQCCIGLFPITQLDVDRLREGMRVLASDVRGRVERRAREQQDTLATEWPRLHKTAAVDHWTEREMDEAAHRFSHLRCPALEDDGSCAVYAYRPVTCRTMGIPIETDGLIHGACGVQTAVPIIALSSILRIEEDRLAEREARALAARRSTPGWIGEEVWLPYGFVAA